jgi:hypothetical protein
MGGEATDVMGEALGLRRVALAGESHLEGWMLARTE